MKDKVHVLLCSTAEYNTEDIISSSRLQSFIFLLGLAMHQLESSQHREKQELWYHTFIFFWIENVQIQRKSVKIWEVLDSVISAQRPLQPKMCLLLPPSPSRFPPLLMHKQPIKELYMNGFANCALLPYIKYSNPALISHRQQAQAEKCPRDLRK